MNVIRSSALLALALVAIGALALPASASEHGRNRGHQGIEQGRGHDGRREGGHERRDANRGGYGETRGRDDRYGRRGDDRSGYGQGWGSNDRHERRDDYAHGYRGGARRDDRYRDHGRVVYRPVVRRPQYRGYYSPPHRVVYAPARRQYWQRGGRYYGQGYGQTYVVNDYYGYGLRQPPRGYYWRRSDLGDFLLVAAATGIIADLVLHH